MKRPLPSPLSDAPEGTTWFGGAIGWFSVSLHVTSNELNPIAISSLFKIEPTHSQSRGVPILNTDGSSKRTPKFGRWTLQIKPAQTDEWDIEEVMVDLLSRLPSEVEVWSEVSKLGEIHFSLGLSLNEANQSFSFSPSFIAFLGERYISVSFDVYDKKF